MCDNDSDNISVVLLVRLRERHKRRPKKQVLSAGEGGKGREIVVETRSRFIQLSQLLFSIHTVLIIEKLKRR
jgi:hypothetical protein